MDRKKFWRNQTMDSGSAIAHHSMDSDVVNGVFHKNKAPAKKILRSERRRRGPLRVDPFQEFEELQLNTTIADVDRRKERIKHGTAGLEDHVIVQYQEKRLPDAIYRIRFHFTPQDLSLRKD